MVGIAPCSLRLPQRSEFANAYQGAADLLKGLSPTCSKSNRLLLPNPCSLWFAGHTSLSSGSSGCHLGLSLPSRLDVLLQLLRQAPLFRSFASLWLTTLQTMVYSPLTHLNRLFQS